MNTRDQVLRELENAKGDFISGEELALRLNVSRNSIWKAIHSLQEDGYPIGAVRNRGYCLDQGSDILSAQGMEKYLTHPYSITVFDTVPSTNTLLKELAAQGAPEGTVIIARGQTGGRGRTGKSFYSPAGTGLYMSLLLRPDLPAADALSITTSSAVAVARAIETVSGRNAEIKWVNDIYLEDRKVCGILSEAAFNMETGTMDYVIVGIGINLFAPEGGFPDEISQIATAVFPDKSSTAPVSCALAAAILNEIAAMQGNFRGTEYVDEYIRRSLLPGREVLVSRPDGEHPALAVKIGTDCRLLVQYPDGQQQWLSSGEVSIHLDR